MDAVLLMLLPLAEGPVEKGPDPNDVVAGWTAFAIFGLLILAVVVLGFSLTKHLKRADAAEEKGLFDPTDRKKPAAPRTS